MKFEDLVKVLKDCLACYINGNIYNECNFPSKNSITIKGFNQDFFINETQIKDIKLDNGAIYISKDKRNYDVIIPLKNYFE